MKSSPKIGWVRAMKRYSESTQRAALAEAGVDEMKVYTDREGRLAMLADLGAGGTEQGHARILARRLPTGATTGVRRRHAER